MASRLVGGGPLVPPDRLAIQLFTVRDVVRLDRPGGLGFGGAFGALAACGYAAVEFAGYRQHSQPEITIAELRDSLADHGLAAVGSLVGYAAFVDNPERVLDEAQALGLDRIGTGDSPGRYGDTGEGYRRAADDFNAFGAAAAARGMRWYHHNHDGEFAFDPATGERLYDVLLSATDPGLVSLEMDIFWAYVGQHRFGEWVDPDGAVHARPLEPLDYVRQFPDRYLQFHVKDGTRNPDSPRGYDFANVGGGDLDLAGFLAALPRGPAYRFIVERDDASADPQGGALHAARVSAEYLLGLRA